MIERRALIAAGFLISAFSGSALAQRTPAAEDPLVIVQQIYKMSAGKNGKYSGQSAFFLASARKKWFSKSLNAALAAMDKEQKRTNEVALDFDPVTNSQDPSVKNLAIAVESASESRSIVAAKFFARDAKEPITVRYIFVREADAWKLDDMSGDLGGKDGWKLREIIK